MSIIALTTAKAHLRLESDYPDDQVQGKLDAAESSAAQFLNRRIFEDQDALNAAVAARWARAARRIISPIQAGRGVAPVRAACASNGPLA